MAMKAMHDLLETLPTKISPGRYKRLRRSKYLTATFGRRFFAHQAVTFDAQLDAIIRKQ